MKPQQESPLASIFIAGTTICGGTAIAYSAIQLYLSPPQATWLILAALTLLSGLFTIRVPSISATISVSETFIFTTVLLFGTPAAAVTVAFEALLISWWRHRREARKVLFNATQPALSLWLAANLFYALVQAPLRPNTENIATLIAPMLALAATYFLLNSWLTATAVGLVSGMRISRVWREHFAWLSLHYFVGASVALMIVQSVPTVGLTTLGIILPLLALSYFTMKSAMGRLDDANTHIAKVEQLYLSTVESLAMAIDAKDQVTHGHIRRVQELAIELATELGVKDVKILKAIEAAALLHDMGKLAIPEYILNKPGKLTTSEFEKMKLHASIGADILSSIDFPYPVVPIVRHHHENWDGMGYPDGISGASIPIGARILAVVDCFDALTSDRPYRRKMTDAEALDILRQRRGSMYDPLVVDTFVRAYARIRPIEQMFNHESIHGTTARSRVAKDIARLSFATRDDHLQSRWSPFSSGPMTEVGTVSTTFEKYLFQLFPSATSAVYALDESREELTVVSAVGTHKHYLKDVVINVGDGVSGWVAANRRIAFNSDPVLDFGHNRTRLFKHCVSAPILTLEGKLLGVITTYSDCEPIPATESNKFSEAAIIGSMIIAFSQTSGVSPASTSSIAG